MKQLILGVVLSCAFAGAAAAADIAPQPAEPAAPPPPMQSDPFIDELRLGVYAHDPSSPEAGSADLNVEVLFAKPWGTDAQWWLPRPNVGATINFDGKTSIGYAGVVWQYDVTNWAFVELGFGGSVNNGNKGHEDDDMNPLGCNVLFHEQASLGFNLTQNWRLIGTVEHSSNAGLCDFNRGLTDFGVRIGYKF
jgi:opacity protein-like surface antigen